MSEIFAKLPRQLQIRFAGLSSWAKSLIESDEASWGRTQRTTAAEMRQVQSLFVLVLLDRFFRRGTQAAIKAVDHFDALDVGGFSVGSTKFEGRNENVMRGERLSEQIRDAVPQLRELANQLEQKSGAELALSLRNLVRRRDG